MYYASDALSFIHHVKNLAPFPTNDDDVEKIMPMFFPCFVGMTVTKDGLAVAVCDKKEAKRLVYPETNSNRKSKNSSFTFVPNANEAILLLNELENKWGLDHNVYESQKLARNQIMDNLAGVESWPILVSAVLSAPPGTRVAWVQVDGLMARRLLRKSKLKRKKINEVLKSANLKSKKPVLF